MRRAEHKQWIMLPRGPLSTACRRRRETEFNTPASCSSFAKHRSARRGGAAVRREAAVWILLAVGAALAIVWIARPDLIAGRGRSLLYATLLLAFVGSSVWAGGRAKLSTMLYQAVIWLAIVVGLAGGYRLWQSWTTG
jgi:hypothetical protein